MSKCIFCLRNGFNVPDLNGIFPDGRIIQRFCTRFGAIEPFDRHFDIVISIINLPFSNYVQTDIPDHVKNATTTLTKSIRLTYKHGRCRMSKDWWYANGIWWAYDKFHSLFYAASLNAWSINVSFSNGHQTRDQHISNNVEYKTISLRPRWNPRFAVRIHLILSRQVYWPYIRREKDEIHINARMDISLHDFLFICTIWFCQHTTHWQTSTGRIWRRKKQNRCKNKCKRKGTNKREQNKPTATTAAATK